MKKKHFLALCFLLVFSACTKNVVNNIDISKPGLQMAGNSMPAAPQNISSLPGWRIIFEDDFSSGTSFDVSKWSYCPRINPDWGKYLTSSSENVNISEGNLILTMDNRIVEGDPVPYHSGGIETSGKFNFTYGKVEVSAKFTHGQGSWPAIWMMPQNGTYGEWPKSGEIDIMEHLNNDNFVYMTLHGQSLSAGYTYRPSFNVSQYNTYGIEWYPNTINFLINGSLVGTYIKAAGGGSAQWPFDQPFYIILNQSGGGSWSGPVKNTDLPFKMNVDYVRVYKPDTAIVSGGIYTITTAMNSSSSLDLYNGSAVDNTNVILWHQTGGSNQRWQFTALDNGYYKINPVNAPSLALSVPGSVNTGDTQLKLLAYNGSTGQQWKIAHTGNGYFTLSPVSGLTSAMDVFGATTLNGSKIIIWSKNESINQKFILKRAQ